MIIECWLAPRNIVRNEKEKSSDYFLANYEYEIMIFMADILQYTFWLRK